jgi:putative protease
LPWGVAILSGVLFLSCVIIGSQGFAQIQYYLIPFYIQFKKRLPLFRNLYPKMIQDFEIMAPAGSPASLAAAIQGGADSVYFGVEHLNMRARSSNSFAISQLHDIAQTCRNNGLKSYLTLNTIIYDDDLTLMRTIMDAARSAGISAVIAADVAVMQYARQIGQEIHLSTQLNISNVEALKFYAQFAGVVVLARELNLEQTAQLYRRIQEENICSPGGERIRIEMFCHGALCMAISGKCYLSLHQMDSSANRGACMQVCRRAYTVKDKETGAELEVDNSYIMSPKDLKTIHFIDKMIEAGVRVFKIEGRARGPEYVRTVCECYKQAIQSYTEGTYTPDKIAAWDERLQTVFNRGFWDGYYLGQPLGEWSSNYGSQAIERKVYAGKAVKYFSNIGVAEFLVEAAELNAGDKLLITGPTTGAIYTILQEARVDLQPVPTVKQRQHFSMKIAEKIRPNDKLFKIETHTKTSTP